MEFAHFLDYKGSIILRSRKGKKYIYHIDHKGLVVLNAWGGFAEFTSQTEVKNYITKYFA